MATALVLPAGCRCAGKSQPPNTPSISATVPPTPVITDYTVFRPVMPAEAASDPPPPSEIDQLRQEITSLKEQLKQAQNETVKEVTKPPLPLPKDLPHDAAPSLSPPNTLMINKEGVSVSTDAQKRIHIEAVDRVLFMPNTWQLAAGGEETLRSIAAELKVSHPGAVLDIEGHTDSIINDPKKPTQKHDLSSTKSLAVTEFFITVLKWDASRIRTSSYGKSRPVADNGTPEGRARNNRIEIVVQDD